MGHLVGFKLKQYVDMRAEKEIPEEDRKNFIQDVFEDLEQLDESRIVGLGITLDELSRWLHGYRGEA